MAATTPKRLSVARHAAPAAVREKISLTYPVRLITAPRIDTLGRPFAWQEIGRGVAWPGERGVTGKSIEKKVSG